MSAGIDIASLSVDIDSSAAESATVNFQDLVRVAQSLEQMFERVDKSVRTTSATLGQTGSATNAATTGLRQYGEAARGAASPMDNLVAASKRAYDGFTSLVGKLDGARESLRGLTSIRLDNLSGAAQQTARVGELAESYRELAGSVEQAVLAQRRADQLRPAGGGGGGTPPTPPSGGGGGGRGGSSGGAAGGGEAPEGSALIDRMIRDIETRIGRLNIDDPRRGEQYLAARRAGADDLPVDGRGAVDTSALDAQQGALVDLVGVWHDLAQASRAAQQAETARAQQAGSQYQQRLNEHFGISIAAGDPSPKKARDSAAVFKEAFGPEDEYQKRLAGVQATADPVGAGIRKFAAEVEFANQALARGDLSMAQYSEYLDKVSAGQQKLLGTGGWAKDAAADADRYARSLQELLAKADPVGTALQNYAKQVALIEQASASGDITPKQRDAAMDVAQSDLNDRSGATAAANAADRYADRANALRAALDPLSKSQQAFNKEVAEARDLLENNAITAMEYQTAVQKASERQTSFNATLDKGAKQAGLTGQQYFWMLSNVKDFFNQVYAGGSLTTAAMQQGPMLAQIMAMGEGGIKGSIKGMGQLVKRQFVSGPAADDPSSLDMMSSSTQVAPSVETDLGRRGFASATGDASNLASVAEVLERIASARSEERNAGSNPPEASEAASGLDKLGGVLRNFRVPIGLVATGLTTAAAAALFAYYKFDQLSKTVERSTYGIGRRSGMSMQAVNNAGDSIVDYTAGIGMGTAREAAAAVTATGNVGTGSFSAVLGNVKDYAYTTNQDVVPAAKELAEALDGSSSGLDRLNAKTGFLNATTRELYMTLSGSGDKVGAQKVAMDALALSLEKADERLGFFARNWNRLSSGVGTIILKVGSAIDQATGGGTVEERIAAQKKLIDDLQNRRNQVGAVAEQTAGSMSDAAASRMAARMQASLSGLKAGIAGAGDMVTPRGLPVAAGSDSESGLDATLRRSASAAELLDKNLEDARKQMEELNKEAEENARKMEEAKKSKYALDVDDILKSMNPLSEQINKIQINLAKLRDPEFRWALPTDRIREADQAIAALSRQLKQLGEDAKAGGAQFNEMVISAQNAAKQVGFTTISKQIADIRDQAAQQKRDIDRQASDLYTTNRDKIESLQKRLVNPINDVDRANVQKQIDDLKGTDLFKNKINSIDTSTALRENAIRDENRVQATSRGGEYGRAPERVRGLIDNVVTGGTAPRVSPDLAAAVFKMESSYIENNRPPIDKKTGKRESTAYGYGQLLDKTAAGLGVDKYDPQQNVEGSMRYLDEQIKKFGSVFNGLVAYYAGPGAADKALKATGDFSTLDPKYAKHARDIMAASGELGGTSTLDRARAEFTQEAQMKSRRLEVSDDAKYGGNNQYLIDRNREYNRLYQEELEKSGQVAEPLAAKFRKMASEMAGLNQEAAKTQMGKDMTFQLEQMGRSNLEAPGYAKLRQAGIPADGEMGQALLSQSRYLEGMQQLRGAATDVWGSISQGIMSGAKASDIALSAISKIESKLLDMAGNTIISSLFEGITGTSSGGASSGLNLGSLFSGGKGLGGGPSNGGFIDGIKSLFGGGSGTTSSVKGSDLFGGGGWGGGAEAVSSSGVSGGGILDLIKSFFGFANGGIMTPLGPMPLRKYAGGGIASTPQVAMFGEGSMNEAYVPLPDGRSIPVTLDGRAGGSAAQSFAPSFVADIKMSGSSGDARADAQHADETARTFEATMHNMFQQYVANESRPGGSMYKSGTDRSGY